MPLRASLEPPEGEAGMKGPPTPLKLAQDGSQFPRLALLRLSGEASSRTNDRFVPAAPVLLPEM